MAASCFVEEGPLPMKKPLIEKIIGCILDSVHHTSHFWVRWTYQVGFDFDTERVLLALGSGTESWPTPCLSASLPWPSTSPDPAHWAYMAWGGILLKKQEPEVGKSWITGIFLIVLANYSLLSRFGFGR